MKMRTNRDYIYKDIAPQATVRKIRHILKNLNINVKISDRTNNLNLLHSCGLTLEGLPYGTSGKSYTRHFAEASAYGELMERLQNQLLYKHVEFSPKTRSAYGFTKDPLEKILSGKDIPSLPDDFRQAHVDEGRIDLYTLWEKHRVQLRERGLSVTMLPFYNVQKRKIAYLPSEFITDFFGSNGMCAGNTQEEAIDQGLSEICERFVQRELYLKEITPPNVPDEFLMQNAPTQYAIIENLRQAGGYRIIVKDCSLGLKFPVLGVIFFQPKSGHYCFSLGASPIWQVALERCLTEAFQGFSIGSMWKLRPVNLVPPFTQKSDTVQNYINYINLVCTEVGYYPPALFNPVPGYQFKGFSRTKFKTQKDKVQYLIRLIRQTGRNIYIRDASILGWPAFSIISPGISEILSYSPYNWKEVQTSYSRIEAMSGIDDLSTKKMCELVEDMTGYLLSALPLYSRNTKVPFITLAHYLRVPGHENMPWQKISLQIICALLAGYLKDWGRAFEQLSKYVADREIVFATQPDYRKYWIRAVIARDWFGLRAGNISPKNAQARLELAYGSAIVGQVLNILTGSKPPSSLLRQWFPDLQLPRCWDCRNCSMQKGCLYGELEKLHMSIKNAAANRPIDQMSIEQIIAE